MIPEFYYAVFPRQFRLRKRERSSSYVTDDEDENGRKGHVRKERNYSKTASKSVHYNVRIFDVQSASGNGMLRTAPSRFRLFMENLNAVVTPNRLM